MAATKRTILKVKAFASFHVPSIKYHFLISLNLFQGGQDILSMMGQLMKPKKTEITGEDQNQQ